MNAILKKKMFEATSWYLSLKDKYRVEYYAFKYSGQVDIGDNVLMSSGTSISMVWANKSSFLKIKNINTFRKFCNLTLDNNSCIEIGTNNFFNNNCSINCLNSIIIGDNNLFGEGVKIYDHNHRYSDTDELIINQGFNKGEVRVGNNCWIGSNTIILNNVVIGDNVIIGANNLIHKSIPANSIVRSGIQATINSIK